MKRINQLGIDLSNKIAAGEVVERPFSVVKELVENSIDAKASKITIEILEGGQKYIKITDNGHGIHPDDINLSFMPHATSKITNVEDLSNIQSMGFRGEALASIASVSKVILKSKQEAFDSGKEISIIGGEIEYIKDVGLNTGTIIEVSDLFYNVPARLKFLKSAQREAALINDIICRLSLSYPNISFTLYNNNKKVLSTYGNGSLEDCIRLIYGKEISENVMYFEKHSDTISIHGYIGNVDISRGSRNNQSAFVNNRYIKNRLIGTAVETAFKSFLTVNKFPFFVLFMTVYPEFIDVNVHPTKAEIKFSEEREIFKIIFDTVHETIKNNLNKNILINNDSLFFESVLGNESLGNEIDKTIYSAENSSLQNESSIVEKNINILPDNTLKDSTKSFQYSNSTSSEKEFDSNLSNVSKDSFVNEVSTQNSFINNKEISSTTMNNKFSYKIIGQFMKTYIMCEVFDELYIIDQHAAHEKILFETYTKEFNELKINSQILAFPVVIELTPNEFMIYLENEQLFNNSGFKSEVFGDNTVVIKETPYLFEKLEVKKFFLEIIDNLSKMGSGTTAEVKFDKIARLACRAAIKANDSLSEQEMKYLIDKLMTLNEPFNCPHGRPTIIKLTKNELEKRFKRIQ